MDTLKDIWASMVAGVQERTTNPLTFSFIASWCLWNFKFFFILAGDGTTAERLKAVDALYPITWSTYLGHGFGLPLVTAALYVFVYPSVSAVVIERYRKKQVEISNSVREIEGNRLLTVEESSRLTRNHEVERTTWQEAEAKLQEQLRQVRDALTASEKDVAQLHLVASSGKAGGSAAGDAGRDKKEASLTLQLKKRATAETGAEVFQSRDDSHVTITGDVQTNIVKVLAKSTQGLTSGQLASSTSNVHSAVVVGLSELKNSDVVEVDSSGLWTLTDLGHRLGVMLLS